MKYTDKKDWESQYVHTYMFAYCASTWYVYLHVHNCDPFINEIYMYMPIKWE
jgi:hypothetical protein